MFSYLHVLTLLILLPKSEGPAVCHSKANKQARLVENWLYFRCQQLVWGEGRHLAKDSGKELLDRGRKRHAETLQSALTSPSHW